MLRGYCACCGKDKTAQRVGVICNSCSSQLRAMKGDMIKRPVDELVEWIYDTLEDIETKDVDEIKKGFKKK
jgi:hypothetical protein